MVLNYPEWYKVEKEASEVLKSLTNFKDLIFYINNSNPNIRRQAILRINHLRLLEGINILEEILNNPSEDLVNKELAGWTIKKIGLEHGLDLFISNSQVDKYTGEEDQPEFIKFTLIEPKTPDGFFMIHSPFYKDNEIEEDYLIRDQEVDFQTDFNLNLWLDTWKDNFLSTSGDVLKRIPTILWSKLLILLVLFWSRIIKKLFHWAINSLISLYNQHKNRLNPIELLKKLVFSLLFIIFTPFRVIRNNKSFAFLALAFLFLFFSYTSNGEEIATRFLGQDFKAFNHDLLIRSRDFTTSFYTEAANISKIWLGKIKTTSAWQNIQEYLFSAVRLVKDS
ncbi:MAG: hypothetical protein VR72_17105 [Clostridiaceae bacterium BRH_c20a]|nr:MAG: hypothetical protein VR72_17105 [Clostridiaceae bacterium BRH_c20a]